MGLAAGTIPSAMTVKPVQVRAWRYVCLRCGAKGLSLKRPGARCPKCKARNWSRPARPYRRKK
jgi:DNA-directed RNA polymerase subunit RPC12/RpoP